jgi:hypothetical protein
MDANWVRGLRSNEPVKGSKAESYSKHYWDGWHQGYSYYERKIPNFSDGYEACMGDHRRDTANLYDAKCALEKRAIALEERERLSIMAYDVNLYPMCSHRSFI